MNEPDQFIPENLRPPSSVLPAPEEPVGVRPRRYIPLDELRPPSVKPGMSPILIVLIGVAAFGTLLIACRAIGLESSLLLVQICLAVPIYFLPCILAGARHRNYVPIAVINLFLGWTILGWVAALVWALYRAPQYPSR